MRFRAFMLAALIAAPAWAVEPTPVGLNWGVLLVQNSDTIHIDWGKAQPFAPLGTPLLPLDKMVLVAVETVNSDGVVFRAKKAASADQSQMNHRDLGIPADAIYCSQAVRVTFAVHETAYNEVVFFSRDPARPVPDPARCGEASPPDARSE